MKNATNFEDKLIMLVVRIMRWFNCPLIRLITASILFVVNIAAWWAYIAAAVNGVIGFGGIILLAPIMIGLVGLFAKSLS